MGDNSSIEWTDATWNPLAGCSPVSEGCRNCYAAKEAIRLQGNPNLKVSAKYAGTAEMRGIGENRRAVFTGRINLDEEALRVPLRWQRPRRVFVNSMSDLFHPAVPDEFIGRVWDVMARSPRHTFQVLTKRPDRMAELLPRFAERHTARDGSGWPLRNVWVGTSVEDQAAANERIPHLLRTPAAVRFLSCEPLLGSIDLTDLVVSDGRPGEWHMDAIRIDVDVADDEPFFGSVIHWVIAGGESGPHARPMHPVWVRSLRNQCEGAGVAFFFKQWGEWKPISDMTEAEYDRLYDPAPQRDPEAVRRCRVSNIQLQDDGEVGFRSHSMLMFRVGKHAAGRQLDGRTWATFPVEVAR